MIAMSGQLICNTAIPVCLWFFTRHKAGIKFRDRRGQTLFIDPRKFGHLVDRVHRELSDEEIAQISQGNHAWRGEKGAGDLLWRSTQSARWLVIYARIV
jgi:type I restriction enzyme M protein